MSLVNHKWLLPAGVDELLPPQAENFVGLQQKILHKFFSYGYQLFLPPLVEFADSLSIDKYERPEEAVVHLIDNSEQLGLRADFTPQAARVEASKLDHHRPNRICYYGDVFRNQHIHDQFRNPVQAGVELFGDGSIKSDMEVILLLVDCLTSLTTKRLVLDLGHAQLWRRLVELAELSAQDRENYFTMLTTKQIDRLSDFVIGLSIPNDLKNFLTWLPRLYGNETVLIQAKRLAKPLGDNTINRILKDIQLVINELKKEVDIEIFVDLGEIPGYSYHNGLVFGTYFSDKAYCFARGGRYDTIAANYGKSREATGFSMDIRSLFYYLADRQRIPQMIFAPYSPSDSTLKQQIRQLRQQGNRVVCALNRKHTADLLGCNKQLYKRGNRWVVDNIN